MRAIIIEDEKNAAILLEQMLKEIEPSIVICDTCSDLPAGIKSIKRNNPDAVFLDIELPVYSGIQLLDFFNPEEITFNIIFTTASGEYAVRAFEMSAVDYLMKPIQEEKLRAAIKKLTHKQVALKTQTLPVLKQNFQHNSKQKIVVPVTHGLDILNLDDIYYFKAEGSYTKIFFQSGEPLLVSKNLKHFEFILSGINNFLRIHRSYIVNINFAKKIIRKDGGMLFLENKTELPVADERMDKLICLLQT
ncbi:MAG TPA: LytTR family DNA-binding domain-containing protein [Parafilimonas sp.]|nr:LytTR family DNA-binding domain-containing protein [Parafilimonas sp.]